MSFINGIPQTKVIEACSPAKTSAFGCGVKISCQNKLEELTKKVKDLEFENKTLKDKLESVTCNYEENITKLSNPNIGLQQINNNLMRRIIDLEDKLNKSSNQNVARKPTTEVKCSALGISDFNKPITCFSECTTDEQVKRLLSKGKDINAYIGKTKTMTPLHFAVHNCKVNLLELLLSNGANVNARDFELGSTPLHYAACKNKHYECCRILIKYGADVDALNYVQQTPLFIAVHKPGIFKLLIDSGADVNKVMTDNYSILSYCVNGNMIGNVAYLLQNGADVNVKTSEGNTPLFYAVLKSNYTIVYLLIEYGADVNAIDDDGFSVLDIAYYDGDSDIVNLLESKGAKCIKNRTYKKRDY